MSELKSKIIEALDEAEFVLGWTATGSGAAAPARFHNAGEAEDAVFDSTCVHNLAVQLPRLKDKTVGIVAKSCDARSIVQLAAEREVDLERVKLIAVDCPGMIDVKSIRRSFGFGASIEDDGTSLRIASAEAEREEFIVAKCRGCEDRDGGAGDPGNHPLREKFYSMSAVERRAFWRDHYSRCIRCYACREACPMCFCRDVCIMQTRDPHWIGGGVNSAEAEMMQLIRVNHLAGRCSGCGECERACPVGIPLMLLIDEQNRVIQEMFGYRAGIDPEAKPPLLSFNIKGDIWEEE